MKKIHGFFLLFVIAISFINAQNRGEITENGIRYLFKNADETVNGYMVIEYKNKSMIFTVESIDFEVGVIQLMNFHTIYDNDSLYIIPEWWYTFNGSDYSISKVKGDIYTINWGEAYVTKIQAGGAWATAVLDIYN